MSLIRALIHIASENHIVSLVAWCVIYLVHTTLMDKNDNGIVSHYWSFLKMYD